MSFEWMLLRTGNSVKPVLKIPLNNKKHVKNIQKS